ncbi:MAG: GHKL domain-containing protein [Candidatus Sericytochromatia bacterium]|nr:GHKL domain-containing protein [Candidatus Sericytochromatia bacterium]
MSDFKNGIVILNTELLIQYIDDSAKDILKLDNTSLNKNINDLITDKQIVELISKSKISNKAETAEVIPSWNEAKTLFFKVESYITSKESGTFVFVSDLSNVRRLEGIQKEFVANVSHELRTPLTSIKMAAESLQLGAIDDEKMRNKFLSNIQREADRLTRLVNELLVIANLDNKVTLHISKFDPIELLSDVVTVMRHHATLNDLTLIDNFPETLPFIEADKDRIQQVLINLTDNAIKCNRQNGKVTLTAYEEKGNLVVKVKDTGIGIHKVDIDKIFDRFFRVDRSRSRVTGGTGLGLSIVKDIIIAHGGTINVESEVDVGTTLIVSLPFKTPIKQTQSF